MAGLAIAVPSRERQILYMQAAAINDYLQQAFAHVR